MYIYVFNAQTMHKDESHAEELIYAVKTFSLCQHFACQDGFKSMCGSGSVKSPSYIIGIKSDSLITSEEDPTSMKYAIVPL